MGPPEGGGPKPDCHNSSKHPGHFLDFTGGLIDAFAACGSSRASVLCIFSAELRCAPKMRQVAKVEPCP